MRCMKFVMLLNSRLPCKSLVQTHRTIDSLPLTILQHNTQEHLHKFYRIAYAMNVNNMKSIFF